MACRYPDRWLAYSSIGAQVEGTQFVALKVPLEKKYFTNREDESFTPDDVVQQIPNLGLVIDLTFTSKYYNPLEFQQHKVQHKKILTKGHEIPQRSLVDVFIHTVNKFLEKDDNKGKVIGVHCTHGLNRTGYFVCAYMILVQGQEPRSAIKAFNDARTHSMERANYLNHLRGLKPSSYDPSLHPPTDNQEKDRYRREARSNGRHHSDRYAGNWRDRSRETDHRQDFSRSRYSYDYGGYWRSREWQDGDRYSRSDCWRNNYRNNDRYENRRDRSRSNGEEASTSEYRPRNREDDYSRNKRTRNTDNSL
ncbi:RNA/RNP complex-1-interacting phosphatase homolog [Armigeres subalbatus]|uniref:RNA/RNP complex-1-interacting phosphatase homolog n=1 Tax=Armigeres subalbatus TaxID=124917 RepID=UPI002ED11FAA